MLLTYKVQFYSFEVFFVNNNQIVMESCWRGWCMGAWNVIRHNRDFLLKTLPNSSFCTLNNALTRILTVLTVLCRHPLECLTGLEYASVGALSFFCLSSWSFSSRLPICSFLFPSPRGVLSHFIGFCSSYTLSPKHMSRTLPFFVLELNGSLGSCLTGTPTGLFASANP